MATQHKGSLMRNSTLSATRLLLLLCAVVALGGCADFKKTDPWEKPNRFVYNVNDGIDTYALKPVSDLYVKVTPKPIRTGLYNGYSNLEYFNVIFNDFLQAKWNQGASDSGRMAVNSTVGVAGIFDVATGWGMPSHNNDFGLTLGTWGFQQGPYLVLPLFGPSTVRDAPGIGVGMVTNPLFWVDTTLATSIAVSAVEAVVMRSNADQEIRFRNSAAIDPYVFTRDAYLQYRENQLHGGKVPPKENIYDEDAEPATAPSTQPATTPPPSK